MSRAAELYLDLLKGCLSRSLFLEEERWPVSGHRPWHRALQHFLRGSGLELVRRRTETSARARGTDWPPYAETMIGTQRLDNLQQCVTEVIMRGVPGDLIETGVWRGGAVILMRAVLKAYGVTDRTVWACDSFEGLPKPDPTYPADRGATFWAQPQLAVSLEQVQRNVARYGLLDAQIRFVKGWFNQTLDRIPARQFAVIRLDGDMYSSTMQALTALYPRLAPGGYCIVDDYGSVSACRQAVEEYRAEYAIDEKIEFIDGDGAYWQRGLHQPQRPS